MCDEVLPFLLSVVIIDHESVMLDPLQRRRTELPLPRSLTIPEQKIPVDHGRERLSEWVMVLPIDPTDDSSASIGFRVREL